MIPSGVLALLLAAAPAVLAAASEDPCVPVDGIQDRCPVWTGSYGSELAAGDVASDVVASPDGNSTFTLGTTSTAAAGIDATIVAHDAASGTQLWVAKQAGPGTTADLPSEIAVAPDSGLVFLAGTICTAATATETCDLVVSAFDAASGSNVWETRVDGPGDDYDSGTGIAVSPEGDRVYVSGVETSLLTGGDAALVALEAEDGDVLWESTYDSVRGFDSALSVALSDDGEIAFIAGPSPGSGTGRDFATIAHDADTGERLWVARRDDHGGDDLVTGMAAGGGIVIVTGTTDDGAQALIAEYATVAYDAGSGEMLWTAKYDGGSFDLPLDISLSPEGGAVYVTGMSRGTTGGYDMATAAYDTSDGRELWAARFNGLANNGDLAWAVEASPDGERVYIAGDTLVPNVDYFHAVIAYEADDGSEVWTGLHRGGGSRGGSLLQGLDVAPDGSRVYYAGQLLAPTTDADFLTLAYDTA